MPRFKDTSLNVRFTAAQLQAIAEAVRHSPQCPTRAEFVRLAVAEKIARQRLDDSIAEAIAKQVERQDRRLRRIEEGLQLVYAALAAFVRIFFRYFAAPSDAQQKLNQVSVNPRYRNFVEDAIMIFDSDTKAAFARLERSTPSPTPIDPTSSPARSGSTPTRDQTAGASS